MDILLKATGLLLYIVLFPVITGTDLFIKLINHLRSAMGKIQFKKAKVKKTGISFFYHQVEWSLK